jgi:two-component system, LytTR family, response regulator
VIVVDDEPVAIRRLLRMIQQEKDLEIVDQCTGGNEAVKSILRHQPDLVFLDIRMPDLDGFGVLEALGNGHVPSVIFSTAYDEFAVKAFETNAVDYLLKPYDQSRFQSAVQRARLNLRSRGDFASLQANLQKERVVIKTDGRYLMLRSRDIDFIEAAGNYMVVHANSHSFLVRERLFQLEERLDKKRFVRIHRSVIVNIDHIRELAPTFHGEYLIILHNGHRMTLSRSYRHCLAQLLK